MLLGRPRRAAPPDGPPGRRPRAAGPGRRGGPARLSPTPTCSWPRSAPRPARSRGSATRRGTGCASRGASRQVATDGSRPSPPVSAPGSARSASTTTPTRRDDPTLLLRVGHGRGPQAAAHRPEHPRAAGGRDADVARAVAGRGQRRAGRPAARGPRRHPRARGARPAGPDHAHAARVGARRGPARSATPTTASPSTGTCGRRRPTRPSSPTGSPGPTCSCSAPCCTTSARATRATTPTSASSWSSASGPAWASSRADVDVLATLVRHHLLLPDVATRRDLTDDGDDRARWPRRSATQRCSTCSTR